MILSDTIAAVSTPRGKGGIAVIRISGGDAVEIAEKIFENGEFFSLGKDSPVFEILDAARKKLELTESNSSFFIKAIY